MESENTISCEEFEEELDRYGIEEKDEIIRIMKIMYMNGGRIPESQGTYENNRILFFIPKIMKNPNLKILIDNIIAQGTGYYRVYYKELTEKGRAIASDCYIKDIMQREKELMNILNKYSKKLLYLISVGCIRGNVIRPPLGNKEEKRSLIELQSYASSEESEIIMREFQEEINKDWPRVRINPGIGKYLEALKKRNLKIVPKRAYEIAFSKFLLNIDMIREEAESIFDELYQHGFAAKLPVFNSKGMSGGEDYSAPIELSFFLNKLAEKPEEEFTLLKYFFILSLGLTEVERNDFYLYMKKFGITEEEVEWGIKFMHSHKITTKYNKETENMPFLIINEEKANDFFNYQLKWIVSKILTGERSKYDT